MDRSGAVTRQGREQGRDETEAAGETPRGAAVEALRRALEAGDGPILLTGEPGVGKTRVTERLARGLGPDWRWLVLDMTPALDPRDFYELIRHGLGLASGPEPGLAGARLALEGVLVEAAAEGVRWALVVEEAHNASDAVLEEVRVLGNRLGRSTGFGGILLVGQNGLVRRLLTRPLAPLAARLAARVHLRPLDSDERVSAPRAAPASEVLARPRGVRSGEGSRTTPRQVSATATASAVALAGATRLGDEPSSPDWPNAPSAVPRPPLVIGEGMVEVGWEPSPGDSEGDDAAEPAALAQSDEDPPAPEVSDQDSPDDATTDEPVRDHYAALQAWVEWSRREGRGGPDGEAAEGEPVEADEARDREPVGSEGTFWAEGQQGFAPYGPLFSRARRAPEAP